MHLVVQAVLGAYLQANRRYLNELISRCVTNVNFELTGGLGGGEDRRRAGWDIFDSPAIVLCYRVLQRSGPIV